MATARVNGVELFYETAGSGERLVLVHGSWGDGANWEPVVAPLAERFEVVTWDRRGHSRSGDGEGPGSLGQDAGDLAGLIEHLGGAPAHVTGNSYGAIVTLALAASRPDLVASATVHEPPLFSLLEHDPRYMNELAAARAGLAAVTELLEAGDSEAAARCFVDTLAFGPGAWEKLPEARRRVFVANAATFLDERRDPNALSVDVAGLIAGAVPLLVSHGTASPALFAPVARRLAELVPAAHVRALDGAGHIPHVTSPEAFVAQLNDFHDALAAAGGQATA